MDYVIENSQSLYERNFDKLTDLFPGLADGRNDISIHGLIGVQITLLERNPFTVTIFLSQSLYGNRPWLNDPGMKIRIYLDAQVAEVISYQGVQALQPFYPYPNPKMLQPNEKRRINQFLGEWLSHLIRRKLLLSA